MKKIKLYSKKCIAVKDFHKKNKKIAIFSDGKRIIFKKNRLSIIKK